MKKAGSSSSKSKTRRTSKSTAPSTKRNKPLVQRPSKEFRDSRNAAVAVGAGAGLADLQNAFAASAVGHTPSSELSPQDAELFRAFQSNLLSLISHELRTPLMGVLNALTLLDEGAETAEFSQAEMIAMARTNAQRLHRALMTLLDLAGLESGTFHARLKEVDLVRLVRHRVAAGQIALADKGLEIELQESQGASGHPTPVLGDPQKLSRALDLCFEILHARAAARSKISVEVSGSSVRIGSVLTPGTEATWDQAWSQSVTGFKAGVASPTSAFAGVLQTEQAFLTRSEEGLGSEFLLLHQILGLHQGSFEARRTGFLNGAPQGSQVELRLSLPELSSEDGLRAVLMSRAYEVSNELGTVALALIAVPQGMAVEELAARIKGSLFRASDAAYALFKRQQVALVLDDCKPEDAPRLLKRIETSLGRKLSTGVAHCPGDGLDPSQLIELAESRLGGK